VPSSIEQARRSAIALDESIKIKHTTDRKSFVSAEPSMSQMRKQYGQTGIMEKVYEGTRE